MKNSDEFITFQEIDSYLFIRILANRVNIKCRPSKLITIPFCEILTDALGQGAHCFVSFLLLTLSKLLSNEFLIENSLLLHKYYTSNCEFHEIDTK